MSRLLRKGGNAITIYRDQTRENRQAIFLDIGKPHGGK